MVPVRFGGPMRAADDFFTLEGLVLFDFSRRSWAEIDLDHIAYNVGQIRKKLRDDCRIMGVVKADAYGHGDGAVAKKLIACGVHFFGVSNIDEAVSLRRQGIYEPILIFGFTPTEYVGQLAGYHITQAVFSESYANKLSEAAVSLGVELDVHIKVDTGMGRIGFNCLHPDQTAAAKIGEVCRLPALHAEGIFTHFAVADESGEESRAYTVGQYEKFMRIIELLGEQGVSFALRHCCNSAGVVNYPEMQLDMVRPGIILYGLHPSEATKKRIDLKPAMQLKSVISMLKEIEPGASVSYGRVYRAQEVRRIATVPIGYADGYPRVSAGKAVMAVAGRRAPVCGRVCMDQLMLDVTGIPDIQEGDTVTVFGGEEPAAVSTDEFASWANTINYETVCIVGKRVPRIFKEHGQTVGVFDYNALKQEE